MANQNRKTLTILSGVAVSMLALGFASKPLYDTFCKITGYGGTTGQAVENTSDVIERFVTVNFDSNVSQDLPWEFTPDQRSMQVQVGKSSYAFYKVKNTSSQPVTGIATYNVAPIKAAPYFIKTECFCFTAQTLEPGKEVSFPVLFFIDSQIADETRLDDIKDITLSYTFFVADEKTVKNAAMRREALN